MLFVYMIIAFNYHFVCQVSSMKFKMQLVSTQMHTNLNYFYFDIIRVKLIIIYKIFLTFPDKVLFASEFSFHSPFIYKPFLELLLHLMIGFTVIRCHIVRSFLNKLIFFSIILNYLEQISFSSSN